MSDQPTLFDALNEAHARHTDPETSHKAARTVRTHSGRSIVLDIFRLYRRLTDEELIEAIARRDGEYKPISDSGARSRRAELVEQGLIRDSGKRGITKSGRSTIIWEMA